MSLAVVEDGVPIAGVVYAPARDEMYDASWAAARGSTAQPIVRRTPAEPASRR